MEEAFEKISKGGREERETGEGEMEGGGNFLSFH